MTVVKQGTEETSPERYTRATLSQGVRPAAGGRRGPPDQARPGTEGQEGAGRDLCQQQHPPSLPEREGRACAASRDQQHLLQCQEHPLRHGAPAGIIPLGLSHDNG